MTKYILPFLLLVCVFATNVKSQTATTNTLSTDTGKKFIPYQITRFILISKANKSLQDSLRLDIEDYFSVTFNRDIDSLIKSKDTIILWLNGQAFPNIKMQGFDPLKKTLTFKLDRNLDAHSPWQMFYAYSIRGFSYRNPQVSLTVGNAKTQIAPDYRNKITIVLSETWMIAWGLIFIIIVTILFVLASKRSNLLRANLNLAPGILVVPTIDPNNTAPQILEKDIPYSLGRFQLAWWTYLVIVSFIYIWMSTDELGNLPNSIALLIGVVGGTSVVSKISEALKINGTGAVPITIDQFNTQYKSKHFFYDLVTDENGLSASRFQFFFFTVFFGLFLAWQVIYNLQFPTFSDGILMLMGISSTTYAGVKFSEK